MVFTLPEDANSVKYLGNLDSNGVATVPVEQWVMVNGVYQRAPVNSDGTLQTKAPGDKLVEQLTESNTTTGTLTFSDNIQYLEIYNTDTNDGVFAVNGFNLHVPAGKSFKAEIGGSPAKTVTVTGATKYIVTRYV